MADVSMVISNPNEGEFLKTIDWNKEEFKELVASITEQYRGLTYTEDSMNDAKKDRAKLNAMKKAISDRRIEVKNAIMAPYTQFEKEVKEVVALIEEPILMIDNQIKEYEERVKEEKKQSLVEYFLEVAAELEGILTFDMIFDQKWLNASVSVKKAKEEIDAKVNSIQTDLRSIETLCDEKYHTVLKDYYMRTLNISNTLAECKRLTELDRKLEEEKARKEEEARLRAEREAAKVAESVPEPAESVSKTSETVSEQAETVSKPVETVSEPVETEEDTKQYKASFTVYGTKAQIISLRQFMTENNIKFGKVEQ